MLAEWRYRKSITASRAAGAVTNYQMLMKVYYGAGADGTESVDGFTAGKMYCDSKCNTDFSDLRFVNSDETLLPYWIEKKVDSDYAIVWVKLDSIETTATTFYVYYGNPSAPDLSSGADTFIVFDDFERGNDGDDIGGDWTINNGDVKISTDHAYAGTRSGRWKGGGAASPSAEISVAHSENIAIRFRVWKEDAVTSGPYFRHGDGVSVMNVYINVTEDVYYYDGAEQDTGSNITPDQWELFEFNDFDYVNDTFDIWLNGSKIKDDADEWVNGVDTDVLAIFNADNTAGHDSYLDHLIIRNWRSMEPAWGSWGAEEFAPHSYYLFGSLSIVNSETIQYLLGWPEMIEGSAQYLSGGGNIVEGRCWYAYGSPNIINGRGIYLYVIPTIVERLPKPIYGRVYQRLSVTEKEVN